MLSLCPACQHKVDIHPDQIDFLVRCDRCRAMYIARSPEAVEFARKLAAQIQADALASKPRRLDDLPQQKPLAESSQSTDEENEEVLAEVAQLAQEQRPRLRTTPRQRELERFQLRFRRHTLGIISICGILGVLLLSGILFTLHNLRSAHATTTPMIPAAVPAKPTVVQTTSTPAGTGELFPEVQGR